MLELWIDTCRQWKKRMQEARRPILLAAETSCCWLLAAAVSVSASAMSNICQNERAGRQAGRRAAAGGHWHGK